MSGFVSLVGAGCGPADLIALRGLERLHSCEAVVYDALVDPALSGEAPPSARRIPAGKRAGGESAAQEDIETLLVELARQGKRVVRLKGGDPFVFGRGGEEAIALERAGIPYEIVPGISSAIAIPELAGIPVTHRGLSRGFHVMTAHTADGDLPEGLEELARQGDTLVFLMGLSRLERIAERLLNAGMAPDTPAAVLSGGNSPHPAAVRGTLGDIGVRTRQAGVRPPAVIVIGETAGLNLLSTHLGPLAGVRVGITGTARHAERLRRTLEREGAQVLRVLESAVAPLPLEQDLTLLSDGTLRWLVFTSGNGVEVFFRRLREAKVDLRRLSACRFACVGPATAEALEERGFLADLVPREATTRALGEELGSLLRPREEVWLLRSRQGDPLLRETLEEIAAVTEVPLYETVPERTGPLPELDYLTFSSAGGVTAFRKACGGVPEGTRCVCIGPVTARAAREQLRAPVLEAKEISAEGIVNAIREDREKAGAGENGKEGACAL